MNKALVKGEKDVMEHKELETLFSESKIKERVAELAKEITHDYEGKKPVFVGVLNGAFAFFSDLVRAAELDAEVDFLRASSYEGTETSGEVSLSLSMKCDVQEKDVIIVEDILDTGNTLKKLHSELMKMNPSSVKTAVLLDKPSRRVNDFKADYVCFEIPDLFVVGYGLDYNEKYRNLPFVAVYKGNE